MRKLALLCLLVVTLAVVAVGCGEDDDEEAGATAATAAATAAEADECAKEQLQLVEAGQLTIGTDNPAFPPWFEGTGEFEPWDPTKEPTKKGYEQETAYAIAGQLGFTDDEVKWTVVPFNQSFRPGDKPFDFDINQISYSDERAQAVDFSDSYYDVEQAIVTIEGSKIADAGSIADLKDAKLGAQIGTTSFEAINEQIQPSAEPSVYDTNNDAVSALNAKQVDGIVVDFPTALFMAAVQIEGGKVVGRLPAPEGGEYFGVVLAKDSPLTDCVNRAIQAIKDDGTLAGLEEEWLTGSAPVLE
jgi:polar amino acid transport system substrate-binding protein